MPGFNLSQHCIGPASTSWNSLNWQRYSFDFTIPSTGYEWGDFVFTTLDNTRGIVIDDMCVEEITSGATANAGPICLPVPINLPCKPIHLLQDIQEHGQLFPERQPYQIPILAIQM